MESIAISKFNTCSFVEQGAKKECEDVVFSELYQDGIIQAVFDGHSGSEVAKFCANNLIRTLDKFSSVYWNEKLYYVLLDLQSQIDNCCEFDDCSAGTTAVIVYIDKDFNIYVACIGDSRAMIVDTRSREIMKSKHEGSIQICDTMEHEFKKHDIKVITASDRYITRPHCYSGKIIPEYEYYTQVHGIKFNESETGYYADFHGLASMQPLRSIGDNEIEDMIRMPELYQWKLSRDDIDSCCLIMISDGFESNGAFTIDELAMFVSDPFKFLHDIASVINEDFLVKENTHSHDNSMDHLLTSDSIERLFDITAAHVKQDKQWMETLKTALKILRRYILAFKALLR